MFFTSFTEYQVHNLIRLLLKRLPRISVCFEWLFMWMKWPRCSLLVCYFDLNGCIFSFWHVCFLYLLFFICFFHDGLKLNFVQLRVSPISIAKRPFNFAIMWWIDCLLLLWLQSVSITFFIMIDRQKLLF